MVLATFYLHFIRFLGCLIGQVKAKKRKSICLRTKNLKEQYLQLNAFGCFSSHTSSHQIWIYSFLRLWGYWYVMIALYWKNSQ